MSVRKSLLAILAQGPCYGYQLRTEFERRTGGARLLNVGQIYNTLDRLERDGLVTRGAASDQGHVFWHITNMGLDDVADWLASPAPAQDERDELAMKIALAATLPGTDAVALVEAQRRATTARLEELRRSRGDDDDARTDQLASALVTDAMIARKQAELSWLDHALARLTSPAFRSAELRLSTDRPRRGRPARITPRPTADELAAG